MTFQSRIYKCFKSIFILVCFSMLLGYANADGLPKKVTAKYVSTHVADI
jgi:hypothetical protein